MLGGRGVAGAGSASHSGGVAMLLIRLRVIKNQIRSSVMGQSAQVRLKLFTRHRKARQTGSRTYIVCNFCCELFVFLIGSAWSKCHKMSTI